jgi:hypothetical protein
MDWWIGGLEDWWIDGLVGNEVAMFCGYGSGAWFWIYGFVELKGDLPGLTRTWAGIWGWGTAKGKHKLR